MTNQVTKSADTLTSHSKSVAIYIRVSTVEQNNNYSKTSQLRTINDYIDKYFDDSNINKIVYNDTFSASNPLKINPDANDYGSDTQYLDYLDRPELRRMLYDAENYKFKDVFIYSHDRLSRNDQQSMVIEGIFFSYGIKMHFCDPKEQYANDSTSFMHNFFNIQSQVEAAKLSNRATTGGKSGTLNTTWTGGTIPFGYELVSPRNSRHTRLKVNYQEGSIVKLIFELYIDGFSSSDIAEKINEQNLISRFKRVWTKNSIIDLIKNPIYKGYQTYNKRSGKKKKNHRNSPKDFIQSKFCEDLAIVSEEIWEKANKIRFNNSKSSAFYTTPFLLKGILKCSNCDSILSTKTPCDSDSRIYFCKNKYCNLTPIKANILHKKLFNYLIDITKETNNLDKLYDKYLTIFKTHKDDLIKESSKLESALKINQSYSQQIQSKILQLGHPSSLTDKKLYELQALNNTKVYIDKQIIAQSKRLKDITNSIGMTAISKDVFIHNLVHLYTLLQLCETKSLNGRRLIRGILMEYIDSIYINNTSEITIILK